MFKVIPPEEIFSNFAEVPITINAPVFLSGCRPCGDLKKEQVEPAGQTVFALVHLSGRWRLHCAIVVGWRCFRAEFTYEKNLVFGSDRFRFYDLHNGAGLVAVAGSRTSGNLA